MRKFLLGLLVLLAIALMTWKWITWPHLPAAERGRRIAERTGCFACHGPEGIRGTANPGRLDRSVPTFTGDLMMYASDVSEIREWITDGVPAERAKSQTWRSERDRGTLVMPAFGGRLSKREISDLVAFVAAVNRLSSPYDSLARVGSTRIEELGCSGCHGAGGRLARPNPGSLKGYVPSWDGVDFPELVRNKTEFEEWVVEGRSHRFAANAMARYFLDHAVLEMPVYRDHLVAGDVDAIWAYIEWLRGDAAE